MNDTSNIIEYTQKRRERIDWGCVACHTGIAVFLAAFWYGVYLIIF